jgi:hypothetical protein
VLVAGYVELLDRERGYSKPSTVGTFGSRHLHDRVRRLHASRGTAFGASRPKVPHDAALILKRLIENVPLLCDANPSFAGSLSGVESLLGAEIKVRFVAAACLPKTRRHLTFHADLTVI